MTQTIDAALQSLTEDIQRLQDPAKPRFDPALDMLECMQHVTASYAAKTLFEDVRAWVDDRYSTYFGYIMAEFQRNVSRRVARKRYWRQPYNRLVDGTTTTEPEYLDVLAQWFVDFMRARVEAWEDKKDSCPKV